MKTFISVVVAAFIALSTASIVHAGTEGSVSGNITDNQGVAISNAAVQLRTQEGKVVKETVSSATGEYQFFPVQFGDYQITAQVSGFEPYRSVVHVNSGANTQANLQLLPPLSGKEMVLEVKAKRHLVQNSASTSQTEITHDTIKELPQGETISLPKLITTTTPGTVEGPFGQTFIRGNHANIQYQIDGVQLPDSPSNTFGEAFSPRNIDHMEVITGGVPAEFGERLAAVVNIQTRSGPEKPGGELQLNYGTYNTVAPYITYGGSNESGTVHYFLSGAFNSTDRGLDTPQPSAPDNQSQSQGGKDAVHDYAWGHNEFAKVDWLADNDNKVSFIFFNSMNHYEIPNYPSSFTPNLAFFQPGFPDQFGNGGDPNATTFNYVPSNTNDTQYEINSYLQVVWKHTFSERSFLQLAPYYKYSLVNADNDPVNDLATSPSGATPITGSSPSSFYENRHVNNFGLKGDYSLRPNDNNLVKTGFQFQASRSDGVITIQTDLATPPVADSNPDTGYFESAYLQDDLTIIKPLILNVGVRFDATQFSFADENPTDSALQPRIGLTWLPFENTKLHVFYGRLFQPAPVENLRDTFVSTASGGLSGTACPAGQLCPYDIKAEQDNYYEAGVAQQIDQQVVSANVYYKSAIHMLDDAQLLNTSIAQPYNFDDGYAYGLELSLKGKIIEDLSDYFNYTYEVARGRGVSGGIFAFPAGQAPGNDYQYLDHVQLSTANAGLTYSHDHYWGTVQGLFGSGLRTGSNNSLSLPSHFAMNLSGGYDFHGDTWWTKVKVSGDVLNLFDNVYPITIANGYNGSHYAAGREFFIRLTKEL
jgi:outer membrane cobalamin receptor